MEMQQYTETLHSRMNQLQDERDDLLSRVESIERENRALKEEMEEAKSQLEDSKKTREDLQTRVDEVLASQEKYKRLAENINGMEEDMTKIKAEFPLFWDLICRRDELKSENEKLQAQLRDSHSVDADSPFNCSRTLESPWISRRWNL